MEHMHSDVAAGVSAAFGTVVFTLLLGTAAWLGVWFVSLVGDQMAATWHAMSTAGL